MDIKDRIKKIMDHEQMTAAAFAESIGVAQATISHTLGDRNKYPSTDFIMRLHERYNYISLDWLLTGKGSMTGEEEKNPLIEEPDYPLFASENAKNPANGTTAPENRKEIALGNVSNTTKEVVKQEIIYKERPPRKITEIRIFFDDNTYETFRPEK
ncbi:helix-turn-helix domain-containing protein [Bacteroides sp.]